MHGRANCTQGRSMIYHVFLPLPCSLPLPRLRPRPRPHPHPSPSPSPSHHPLRWPQRPAASLAKAAEERLGLSELCLRTLLLWPRVRVRHVKVGWQGWGGRGMRRGAMRRGAMRRGAMRRLLPRLLSNWPRCIRCVCVSVCVSVCLCVDKRGELWQALTHAICMFDFLMSAARI